MERVGVQLRRDGEIEPALRDGDVLAWDYTSPGTEMIGRSYVLLDLGVKMTMLPSRIQRGDPIWYVALAIVSREDDCYHLIDFDFDIDVFVLTDGRPYRMLDLYEFADAVEAGEFTVAEAIDGLRSWQRFLDTHLHQFDSRDVESGWRDFPPAVFGPMAELPPGAFTE
jgi:hypothetical protein